MCWLGQQGDVGDQGAQQPFAVAGLVVSACHSRGRFCARACNESVAGNGGLAACAVATEVERLGFGR
jgi:hypothetical protein